MTAQDRIFDHGPPWLRERTVFLTRHGSQAYGLATATSDEDFKGVAVPPAAYFLGFARRFEQVVTNDPDAVVYDIRKFFELARDCNPNIVEVLWTEPEDHVIVTPAAGALIDARSSFLSKKARHTFAGYATAQLKRINVHHKWLRDPPKAPPDRADFGLLPGGLSSDQQNQIGAAVAMIKREVATWDDLSWTELDDAARIGLKAKIGEFLARAQVSKDDLFRHTGQRLGYDDNFLAILAREKAYRAKREEWDNYQRWLSTRNARRAELEAKYGYDTKHAMHLVRLLRMCKEILETGRVVVKRPDREELLAIKAGAWSYDELVHWAAEQDKEMEARSRASNLPATPDTEALDALCVRLVESMNGRV
jgi:uncharacterized protein